MPKRHYGETKRHYDETKRHYGETKRHISSNNPGVWELRGNGWERVSGHAVKKSKTVSTQTELEEENTNQDTTQTELEEEITNQDDTHNYLKTEYGCDDWFETKLGLQPLPFVDDTVFNIGDDLLAYLQLQSDWAPLISD